MSTVHCTRFPSRLKRTMGEVEEQTWTCLAASHEDAEGNEIAEPDAIGKRTTTRRAYFAFRTEAEAWLAEQLAEGFRVPDGFSGIASAATFYHGPTDAPGNCWAVNVERDDEPLEKLAPGDPDPRD